jgi:hypothetical protein
MRSERIEVVPRLFYLQQAPVGNQRSGLPLIDDADDLGAAEMVYFARVESLRVGVQMSVTHMQFVPFTFDEVNAVAGTILQMEVTHRADRFDGYHLGLRVAEIAAEYVRINASLML